MPARLRAATKVALDDTTMYARFLWGLRSFLSERIGVEEARDIVRRRLEEREPSFLRLAQRVRAPEEAVKA